MPYYTVDMARSALANRVCVIGDVRAEIALAKHVLHERPLILFVRERLRIFLKRKYSDQSRGNKRVPSNLPVRLGLYQFG